MFRIFGQVINRVGNIADFGHSWGKGFEKQAAHPLPIFLGLIPGEGGHCKGNELFQTKLGKL